MLVPNKATHKANAEALMDFYYQPEVAAKVAAWVNYICPVEGAKEAMEKIDPSLVDNELIFPAEEHPGERLRLHGARREDRADVPAAVRRCDRSLTVSDPGRDAAATRRATRRAVRT